jgi:hypothetical protein
MTSPRSELALPNSLAMRQAGPNVHERSAWAHVLNADSREWFPRTGDLMSQRTREVSTTMTMATKARP